MNEIAFLNTKSQSSLKAGFQMFANIALGLIVGGIVFMTAVVVIDLFNS